MSDKAPNGDSNRNIFGKCKAKTKNLRLPTTNSTEDLPLLSAVEHLEELYAIIEGKQELAEQLMMQNDELNLRVATLQSEAEVREAENSSLQKEVLNLKSRSSNNPLIEKINEMNKHIQIQADHNELLGREAERYKAEVERLRADREKNKRKASTPQRYVETDTSESDGTEDYSWDDKQPMDLSAKKKPKTDIPLATPLPMYKKKTSDVVSVQPSNGVTSEGPKKKSRPTPITDKILSYMDIVLSASTSRLQTIREESANSRPIASTSGAKPEQSSGRRPKTPVRRHSVPKEQRLQPYRCRFASCGHRLGSRDSLREHEQLYHKENMYRCPLDGCCGKTIKWKKSFVIHLRQHKMSEEDIEQILDSCIVKAVPEPFRPYIPTVRPFGVNPRPSLRLRPVPQPTLRLRPRFQGLIHDMNQSLSGGVEERQPSEDENTDNGRQREVKKEKKTDSQE